MATVVATDETFEAVVLSAPRPVLVDFWAAWCGPCRIVGPILEELSNEWAAALTVAKLDTEAAPRTASRFRITSIPTLMLFEGGRPTQSTVGALPKPELRALVEKWVPALRGPQISVAELKAELASAAPPAVLDIRRTQDYARSHIAGAIAAEDLAAALQAIPLERKIVLVCRTGQDSLREAKRLAGRPVFALAKGLLEWEGAGLPTFSTREEEEARARAGR